MTGLEIAKQKKENFLQSLEQKIKDKFKNGDLSTTFETCHKAPFNGWNIDEFNYMPIVAKRLELQGFQVQSYTKWEVTTWIISI